MTGQNWPTTTAGRTALTLRRLADRLEQHGDRPLELAHDFLVEKVPPAAPCECVEPCSHRPPRSREDAADAAAERQLMRDCTQLREGLRVVHDVCADMDERIARIMARAGEGHICPWHRCGRRIDPKKERVKYWAGKEPMHPSCYLARWRFEKGDQQTA